MEPNRTGNPIGISGRGSLHLLALLALLMLLAMGPPAVSAGERVALVIGNSQYKALNRLANPRVDAQAVAARLSANGFALIDATGQKGGDAVYDLDEETMVKAIKGFANAAERSEIALFYYAGHGMQIDGESYLLPVDVKADDIDLLERKGVSLNQALRWLDANAELTVAVFDACRDIPALAETLRRSTRSVSVGAGSRGLGRIPQGTAGRIVAFSGAAGQSVADGTGEHSPYSAILLEHINDAGIDVPRLFQTVANDFNRRYGQQAPEVLTQGVVEPGRYCLTGPCPATDAATAAPVDNPSNRAISSNDIKEMHAWGLAEGKNSCEGYQDFLVLFPNSVYAKLASQKTTRLCNAAPATPTTPTTPATPAAPVAPTTAPTPAAPVAPVAPDTDEEKWRQTVKAGSCEAYNDYYKTFASGKHVVEVRERLVECIKKALTQRALAFVDSYYGSLGHVGCDSVAAMWVTPPGRLCALVSLVEGFSVKGKTVVALTAQEATVAVSVEGHNRGESIRPWQGCLDLSWTGNEWRLVRQHGEQDGSCIGPPAPRVTSQETGNSTSTSQDAAGALAFADAYYAALSRADYARVASMWSDGAQPGRLRSLVENVEWMRLDRKQVVSLASDHASVAVDVTGKAKAAAVSNNRVYLDLVRQYGAWKLAQIRAR